MVLITIDKEYQFPTQLNEITLRQFISISEKINNKDYENVVFDLIKISEDSPVKVGWIYTDKTHQFVAP